MVYISRHWNLILFRTISNRKKNPLQWWPPYELCDCVAYYFREKHILVMMSNELLCVVLLCLFGQIVSPPVDPKGRQSGGDAKNITLDDLGIGYMRYLQQIIQTLEEDKDFAKRVGNVTPEDIQSGRVANELEFVNHNVRNKLDELKRMEMERLRAMVMIQQNAANAPENNGNRPQKLHLPSHLDLKNPHSFEIEDLQNLINAATKDLTELNEKRKEEFKQYELEKEHTYREGLKQMTEEERKVAEAQHQEMINKHKDHPQVHHPGSKPQLEQVWEDVDKLPKEEFEPKTFFRMHDLTGDGYWDEVEVKAVVTTEVRKMYNISNIEDDPIEMHEEYSRMEEHIFKEADKNHDRLISLDEFLDMTKKPDFEQDPGWKGLDEQEKFTPEELAEYERHLAEQAANQMGSQANQQYAYHPVEGVAPNNEGVQFQPIQGPAVPGQQQQQQQPGNPVPPVPPPQGDGFQPGQNMGQTVPPGPQQGQPAAQQPPQPPQQSGAQTN